MCFFPYSFAFSSCVKPVIHVIPVPSIAIHRSSGTRMLVIPSLIVAPWLLTKMSSRKVQVLGFLGCGLCNLGLALGYGPLKAGDGWRGWG